MTGGGGSSNSDFFADCLWCRDNANLQLWSKVVFTFTKGTCVS